MKRLGSVFVWKTTSGTFAWCVGVSQEKIIVKMRTVELALDFAKKLKGKNGVSYIGQTDPEDCLHFDFNTKVLQQLP